MDEAEEDEEDEEDGCPCRDWGWAKLWPQGP
jgi:hypothetical protein